MTSWPPSRSNRTTASTSVRSFTCPCMRCRSCRHWVAAPTCRRPGQRLRCMSSESVRPKWSFRPERHPNTTSSRRRHLHVPSTREFPTLPSTSSGFVTGLPAFPGSLRPQALFTSSMSRIRPLLLRQWRHRSTPRPWAGGSSPSLPRLPALPSSARRSVGRAWSRVRSTPPWWPWACRGATSWCSALRGT